MFTLRWTQEADERYRELEVRAAQTRTAREARHEAKSSREEGLFKQVRKTILLLRENPRHPGLQTHEYHSLRHPYEKDGKVFEALCPAQDARGIPGVLVLRPGKGRTHHPRHYTASLIGRSDCRDLFDRQLHR